MVLCRCSIEACADPAERYRGSCMICARHMCADHVRSPTHTCPSGQDHDPEAYYAAYTAAKKRHLGALLGSVNAKALESAASRARNGIPCRIPALADHPDLAAQVDIVSGQCGGQNCHVDVEFADGITCIARIRLRDPLLPPATGQRPGLRLPERGRNARVPSQHQGASPAGIRLRA
ncbi:hypothetical protein VTK56DRAFT_10063 [Thermocarpiscus australiensis]